MKSFSKLISKPTDFDIAHFFLGASLGLWEHDENFDNFRKHKGIFYTTNPTQDMLSAIMKRLVIEDHVIYDNDDMTYCWNSGL